MKMPTTWRSARSAAISSRKPRVGQAGRWVGRVRWVGAGRGDQTSHHRGQRHRLFPNGDGDAWAGAAHRTGDGGGRPATSPGAERDGACRGTRRAPLARALARRIDRVHLCLPAGQAGRGRAPTPSARGAHRRGSAAGGRAQRARADRASRRRPARRADRPARGDRAGARAARGGRRRHRVVGVAATDRGGAPRQPAGRGGSRVDRSRQREPRVGCRFCAPRRPIAGPPARDSRASRTSAAGFSATR